MVRMALKSTYDILSLPVCLAFILFLVILPCFLLLLNFIASFGFYLYKRNHYEEYLNSTDPRRRDFWDKPVSNLMRVYNWLGFFLHGYEMKDIDNIPDEGGALLISYHAVGPIDAAYVISEIFLKKNRKVIAIINKDILKLRGYKYRMIKYHSTIVDKCYIYEGYQTFVEALEHTPGTIESCTSMLNNGEIILIYPGGMKESLLSDNNYELIWKETAGFAKLAVQTKVPIIPLFTKNSQEAVGRISCLKQFFYNLYVKYGVAYAPIYGFFPVKFKTYIGESIFYKENQSVEELVKETRTAIQNLIRKHQPIPGSKKYALIERFTS